MKPVPRSVAELDDIHARECFREAGATLSPEKKERPPSWYLDPLVALQKRQVHQEWIRAAVGSQRCLTVLKTDLFEEANGDDRIFHDLFPEMRFGVGIDIDAETVRRGVRRGCGAFTGFTCDVRQVAVLDETFDVVLSTSTLDHFDNKRDIAVALDELRRVLRPEGTLIVTLDNPSNPLYSLLKFLTRRGWTGFSLGATLSMDELERMLVDRGFHLERRGYLIHNPRVLSTALFLGLRRVMGKRADSPIRWLLTAFALLRGLPTQAFTGCFLAISAVKQPDR